MTDTDVTTLSQLLKRCKKQTTVNSYPAELRGLSQNRFGGHQSQRLRTYGGSFGPAGPGRRLTGDEFEAARNDLKQRGLTDV